MSYVVAVITPGAQAANEAAGGTVSPATPGLGTTSKTTWYIPFDNHSWLIQAGFVAPVQGWVMPRATCLGIIAALGTTALGREVTLQLGDPTNPTLIQRVIVLGYTAADNDQRLVLLLTDVRWYYEMALDILDINLHRRLGDTRIVGSSVLTNQSVVATIGYAPWSINQTTNLPYDWGSAKDAVMGYLSGALHGRPAVTFVTDKFKSIDVTAGAAKTVQATVSDSTGTMALARFIGAIPSASLYPNIDGTLHVFDATPGAEIDFFNHHLSAPQMMGHGSICLRDNTSLRPTISDHSWRIYVDLEAEVRFTYNTMGVPQPLGGGLWSLPFGNNPYLTPVLRVTDKSLTINDSAGSRAVGQGTWISQAAAFAAWGGVTRCGIPYPTLTDDIVAETILSGGLWNYARDIAYNDPVWASRIAEVLRTYRTYFQVNPAFWSSVRHAWAERAAIWDPNTSTRAKAPVYCNHSYKLKTRPIATTAYQMDIQVTDSYPMSGALSDGRPSGFGVEIVDEELGILCITRGDDSMFPMSAEMQISPTQVPTLSNAVLVQNQQTPLAQLQYAANWLLAVIITCAPAAPNSLSRLFEIQVNYDAAAAAAGLTASLVPNTGSSPDHEIRSHLTQARLAWPVDESTANVNPILARFGISPGDPPVIDSTNNSVTPINLQSELIPMAQAVAAADMLNSLDHWIGTISYPMNSRFVPLGSISSVTHTVRENRAVTTLHCTPPSKPYNPIDFMAGSVRAYILQEIQQKGRS